MLPGLMVRLPRRAAGWGLLKPFPPSLCVPHWLPRAWQLWGLCQQDGFVLWRSNFQTLAWVEKKLGIGIKCFLV